MKTVIVQVPDNIPFIEIGLNNGNGIMSELVSVKPLDYETTYEWSWMDGWHRIDDTKRLESLVGTCYKSDNPEALYKFIKVTNNKRMKCEVIRHHDNRYSMVIKEYNISFNNNGETIINKPKDETSEEDNPTSGILLYHISDLEYKYIYDDYLIDMFDRNANDLTSIKEKSSYE